MAAEAGSDWFITKAPLTGSFAAHTIDAAAQSDSALVTAPFTAIQSYLVEFDQLFSLETNYDGAILEIKIDTGIVQEITAAGGRFITGGYNGTLQPGATPNPIEAKCPGCAAWTGGSGGYSHVVVELPAAANGKRVELRWRVGTDGNVGYNFGWEGYWIDNVYVNVNDKIFANGFQVPL